MGDAERLATRVAEWPALEVRAGRDDDGGMVISGLAAPFGEVATVEGVRERILPGSFSRVLASRRDVLGLLDHNLENLLGRRRNRTLLLREAADGLRFQLMLPDTQLGRDVFVQAERGDLGGVSFGFKESRSVFRERRGIREWSDLDTYEVSLVTAFPAYRQTRVDVGPLGSERDALREWLSVRSYPLVKV